MEYCICDHLCWQTSKCDGLAGVHTEFWADLAFRCIQDAHATSRASGNGKSDTYVVQPLVLRIGPRPDAESHDAEPYRSTFEHWKRFAVAAHARPPRLPIGGLPGAIGR